ncbi:MAG TPA: META domain-containing protein [Sulfurovum sp.]|nr:META domain-containing protein [Sulfurovum sp.]
MFDYKWLVTFLLTSFLWADSMELKILNGSWHLRVMDGMEVRKARAILDFDMKKMQLSGFDACNRIRGTLIKHSDINLTVPMLITTKMACRGKIHNWVSNRLHQTLKERFNIQEENRYGVDGITIKSLHHELFFKKMHRE